MANPTRIIALSPEEMAAFSAACQRIGRIVHEAAGNMVEAFAAAALQLERERRERAAGLLGRWLFVPNPAPTHFGRKRRARRARGRRREARRAAAASSGAPAPGSRGACQIVGIPRTSSHRIPQ
jgi:hypothetical protein